MAGLLPIWVDPRTEREREERGVPWQTVCSAPCWHTVHWMSLCGAVGVCRCGQTTTAGPHSVPVPDYPVSGRDRDRTLSIDNM